MSDEEYLTVREVAQMSKVTEQTVRAWIADGKLKGIKPTGRRNLMIRRGDALAAMGEVSAPQAPSAPQAGAPFKQTDSRVVRPARLAGGR